MRIVLLGAPGAGKGTQAHCLKNDLGVAHISTGDMLRAAVASGTPAGREAKSVMDAGRLVCDDILLTMLQERLAEPDTKAGFILDGYPRNLSQADALEHLLARIGQPLDAVIKLEVPSATIIQRCQIRYAAQQRQDDNPEVVRDRLQIYAEQTAPVTDFYAQRHLLQVVDGVGDPGQVTTRVKVALKISSDRSVEV